MRKRSMIAAVCMLMLCACGQQKESPDSSAAPSEEEAGEAVQVFPMTDMALIGDTMPFFDDGKMNIFYLADLRDGKTGYHPWGLLTTEDYCTFE